jgi:hypothetical protein
VSADQSEASQLTTEIPGSLRLTLAKRESEPLVRIAAARVFRRFPWKGQAAEEARAYYHELPNDLKEEAEKKEFFPTPELRRELREIVRPTATREKKETRRILYWSIERLQNVRRDLELEGHQAEAIEEAVQFLAADPKEAAFFSGEKITSLSPEELGYFATGGFARSAYAVYGKDGQARQALGNQIVKVAAPVWSGLRPQIEQLFRVYLSLYPEAESSWLNWLEEHGGKVPSFIPVNAGQLSVSWQVSWAASAAKPDEFLTFLDHALKSGNERRRLAALNFTEFAIRFGAEPSAPEFGGGTVASDVPGLELEEDTASGLTPDLSLEHDTVLTSPAIAIHIPGLAEESKIVAIEEEHQAEEPRIEPPQTMEPAEAVEEEPALRAAAAPDEVATTAEEQESSIFQSVDVPLANAPAAAPASGPSLPASPPDGELTSTSQSEPPAGSPVAPDQVPSTPGKRYADFTFFRRDDVGAKTKVLDHEPLGKDEIYDLEVAVRTKAIGIPMKKKKTREGIPEPQRGKPVQVLVIAKSEDFKIPEPVQWLELPPAGDSFKNATFEKVTPLRGTPSADVLAKIELRLLYNLNLLEQVVIEAEVIPKPIVPASSLLGLEDPIVLEQELSMREYDHFELIQARQMNVVVKRVTGGFELSFTLLRDGRTNEVLTGVSRVSETDLEKSLMNIRQTLLGISVWDEFANATACTDDAKFQKGLRKLAEKGRALWVKLFEYKIKGALTSIGKLFLDNPLQENALVQVSIDSNATHFVLPWNLLYDQKPGKADVDPKGFWGLRYRIEQETDDYGGRSDAAKMLTKELEIGFLVSRFKEEALQRTFLRDAATASNGRIAPIQPIDSADEALHYLKTRAAQLVLFFAHGHTEFAEAERLGGNKATFLLLYKRLPEQSPLKAEWKDIYDDINENRYEPDESWIKLQYGKLLLLNLYDELGESFTNAPIVFLNMCESAQLTPSLSESFIHLFLDRGACAVIGTECSMRPLFAHYFAEEILKGLFAGEALGDVMLKTRLQFMGQNNPLGLAYTLFGSPLTRFEPPPLARTKETTTTTKPS